MIAIFKLVKEVEEIRLKNWKKIVYSKIEIFLIILIYYIVNA